MKGKRNRGRWGDSENIEGDEGKKSRRKKKTEQEQVKVRKIR